MKRIGFLSKASLAALVLVAFTVSASFATPTPNSAKVLERLYNDCPISTVGNTNTYPALVQITDSWNGLCVGFANGHAWNFSGDGGATSLDLGNDGNYRMKATVTLNGTGTIEGGIHIAPWWNNMDGRFQARLPDGEVACFGGRLPFYSFTANHGVVYTANTPIQMQITYQARALSSSNPARIQYKVTYGVNTYTSPWLFFDQGNASEDPPHGLWGSLDPSLAGGVVQVNNGSNGSGYSASWSNIEFEVLPPVPSMTEWSLIACALALLIVGSVVAMRRRREVLAA